MMGRESEGNRRAKKKMQPIKFEPTTFYTTIKHYNHYTSQPLVNVHHGSIFHVCTGQPNCPDSELAELLLSSRLSGW